MKARVERDALAKALKIVAPAVAKHTNLTATKGVRIETTKAGVQVTATNLDLTITADVVEGAGTGQTGACLVGYGLIANIADKMPAGAVALESDGDMITVTGGGGSVVATVRTMDAGGWPKRTHDVAEIEYKLTADDIDRLARVATAAGRSATRASWLVGILLRDGWAVATDSFRCHAAKLDLGAEHPEVILPADVMRHVIKAAADGCTLRLGQSDASFVTSTMELATRLIAGDFANWRHLLLSDAPHAVTFDRAELVEAIGRVCIMPTEQSSLEPGKKQSMQPPVRLVVDGAFATLTCVGKDVGEATATISAEGELPFPVGYQPEYLIDALKATAGEERVTLRVCDHLKQVTIEAFGGDLLALVMPKRLS